MLLHTKAATHKSFYTQKLLHTDAFTHQSCYTQKLLHTEAFTHRTFLHTEAFRKEAFTHRTFYTQTLLHTEAFTHRCFYTPKLLHTKAFTHRSFLDTEASTLGSFYTQKLHINLPLGHLSMAGGLAASAMKYVLPACCIWIQAAFGLLGSKFTSTPATWRWPNIHGPLNHIWYIYIHTWYIYIYIHTYIHKWNEWACVASPLSADCVDCHKKHRKKTYTIYYNHSNNNNNNNAVTLLQTIYPNGWPGWHIPLPGLAVSELFGDLRGDECRDFWTWTLSISFNIYLWIFLDTFRKASEYIQYLTKKQQSNIQFKNTNIIKYHKSNLFIVFLSFWDFLYNSLFSQRIGGQRVAMIRIYQNDHHQRPIHLLNSGWTTPWAHFSSRLS